MVRDEDTTCRVRAIHADSVEAARRSMLGEADIEMVAKLFKALGDPTRMRILDALRTGELCVCDLSHVLGMSISSVSHQLRLLRQHELVRPRREGKVVFYSLADPHVLEIQRAAMEHVRE